MSAVLSVSLPAVHKRGKILMLATFNAEITTLVSMSVAGCRNE